MSKAIDALKGIASFPGTLLVWMQEMESKVAGLEEHTPMLAEMKAEYERFKAERSARDIEDAARAEQAAADRAEADKAAAQAAADKAAAEKAAVSKKEDPPKK